MNGPEAKLLDFGGVITIWIVTSILFSLLQVWMGMLKCRRRRDPAPPWRECIQASLADGNLFIFSISTAGGALAVILIDFYLKKGQLWESKFGFVLLLFSICIVLFAAHEWTDAKAAHAPGRGNHDLREFIHGYLKVRDIRASIYAAAGAFVCALFTEVLR